MAFVDLKGKITLQSTQPSGSALDQFYRTPSSQVNTLPKAKSETRSKQNKYMHKCSSVYTFEVLVKAEHDFYREKWQKEKEQS